MQFGPFVQIPGRGHDQVHLGSVHVQEPADIITPLLASAKSAPITQRYPLILLSEASAVNAGRFISITSCRCVYYFIGRSMAKSWLPETGIPRSHLPEQKTYRLRPYCVGERENNFSNLSNAAERRRANLQTRE